MVTMAGVYGSALELTCILNEGVITVSGTALVESGNLGKNTYALAEQIKEGDFVSLDESGSAVNTYVETGGLPVVKQCDDDDGWIGIVKSQPVFNKVPASTTNDWEASRLTAGDYRVATIIFPGMTMAFKAAADAAIDAGNPVKFDLGQDAFVDAGTTVTGNFSFHDATVASGEFILVGVGGASSSALLNGDMTGFLCVAA